MKYIKMLLGVSAALALTACSDPVEQVVRGNLEGFQKQDIEKVMATIDPQSPAYDGTKSQADRLLQDYNLDFRIESLTVIEKPDDEKKAMEKALQENTDSTGLDEAIDSFITEEEKATAEAKKREQEKLKAKRPLVARVKVIQVTRDKAGSERFLDNKVTVVHTLHKYPTDEKPEWKIYQSDIRTVDILQKDES
ncbi:MAG: hypothetical protein CVV27_17395 [Candidatus Melainabacteria bacterium HGW-Melainabacteria-1]|nr:MAG: hypothetical protein CVV27_17395 [Candidatus Melainabacteria bacterium HGW-Melainabacteria-1]